MARYFRCGDSTRQCEIARSRKIIHESKWVCPGGKEQCANIRELVPWPEAMWILHRKVILIAGGGLLILLLVGIIVLVTRTGPLQKECEGIRAALGVLETRLAKLESQPTSSGSASPEATLKQVEQKAADVHAGILSKLALKTEDGLKAAKDDLPTFDLLLKQGQTAAQTANKPGTGTGPVAVEVRELIPDLQEVQSRAEGLRNEAQTASIDNISNQADAILESISKDLKRASKLLPKAPAPAPPDLLPKFEAKINALRDGATKQIQETVLPSPAPTPPFPEKDATLVIACSSDLPESLVIPLLKARSGGDAVKVQTEWYYRSKSNVLPQEMILIKSSEEAPYGELISGRVDLVVTDRPPTPAEMTAFEQKFPDASLGSRAHSEVIALDALTLLAHPESPRSKVLGKDAATLPWIGGPVGGAEHLAALRRGFRPSQSVERPEDAVLADKDLLGLGLFHKEGANIKAKRLAYQSSADTRELKPSPFSIATEDYNLSFRIQASTSPASRKGALALVNHITSAQGQEIVANQGYADLRLRGTVVVDPLILATLGEVLKRQNIKGAIRISTNFRFELGKDELDLKAKADMERLPITIARDFPNADVVVIGFTDSVGPVEIDPKLSLQRATRITDELNKSKLPAKPAGLGRQSPVGDNTTEEGRARNRRSEVWVVPE
jgi:outer membrane protein OmpA-like peptidoglycan-associated protein